MIKLSDEGLLSRGANRACYQHPDFSGRCVKVDLGSQQGTRDGTNAIEFAFHTSLSRRLGEVFFHHAPQCYGTAETNRGQGLVFEMIRDVDGMVSRRLPDFLAEAPGRAAEALAGIDTFQAFVREHDIRLFDVNVHNLLVRRARDQPPRLVVIDWKGPAASREGIPVSRYIPWFAHRKIDRRFGRLRDWVRRAGDDAANA